ncbi:MAG: hypothetical protein ACKOC5_17510 [Chloroflexota bacterium]
MNVFIGMKVPRQDAALRSLGEQAARALQAAGRQVFLAWAEIERAGLRAPGEFMPFVRQAIARCDCMLVLYHPELRGGLIELGIAYALEKPIFVAAPTGARISSSALGCAARLIEYQTETDLLMQLKSL